VTILPQNHQATQDPYPTARYAHLQKHARKTETHPRNCLETPLDLVDRVRALLGGGIDLDPCTRSENPTQAERFFTPAEDGILQRWDARRIFVNPPFGRTIELWVQRSLDAGAAGSQVVLLVPAHTSSGWFQRAMGAGGVSEILFIAKRLRFFDPVLGKPTWNAPFASVLLGMNVNFEPMSDLGFRMHVHA
jgi:phage N-6-adenine-methyltransferase